MARLRLAAQLFAVLLLLYAAAIALQAQDRGLHQEPPIERPEPCWVTRDGEPPGLRPPVACQ